MLNVLLSHRKVNIEPYYSKFVDNKKHIARGFSMKLNLILSGLKNVFDEAILAALEPPVPKIQCSKFLFITSA